MTTTNTVLLKFGAIGVLKQADTMPRPPGVSIELGQGDEYLMMTANPAFGNIFCQNAKTTSRIKMNMNHCTSEYRQGIAQLRVNGECFLFFQI